MTLTGDYYSIIFFLIIAQIGSIKLLVFDLYTDKLIQKHVFPPNIAPLDGSFMVTFSRWFDLISFQFCILINLLNWTEPIQNDIVVDMKNNYAYISDSGTGVTPLHAGLVIYDFQVRDPSLFNIYISPF